MSRAINVADAIVSLLNAQPSPFSMPFTAVRDYVPQYDLVDHAKGLLVTVIAAELDESPLTRGLVQSLVSVHVAIQKRINHAARITECDALMDLVESIKKALEAPRALTLSGGSADCGWQKTVNDPIYDPDQLLHSSLFSSVPGFTYLTRRAR